MKGSGKAGRGNNLAKALQTAGGRTEGSPVWLEQREPYSDLIPTGCPSLLSFSIYATAHARVLVMCMPRLSHMIISHSTAFGIFSLKRLFLFAQKCEQKLCILSLSIKLVSLAMKKGNSKMQYDTNYINFRLEMVPTESSEPQVCSLANKVDVQVLEKVLENSTLH